MNQSISGILKWAFFILLLLVLSFFAIRGCAIKGNDEAQQGLVEAELTRQGYTPVEPGKRPLKPVNIPGVKDTIQGQGIAVRSPEAGQWPDTLNVELEVVETAGEPWVKVTIEGELVKWQRLERYDGWPRPEQPSTISITGGYAITSATPWQVGIAWEPVRPGGGAVRFGLEAASAVDLTWASAGLKGSARLGPCSIGAGLAWAVGSDPGIRPSLSVGVAVDF